MFILAPGTLSCRGWMTEAGVASRCPKNTPLTGPVGSEPRVALTAQSCCSMHRLENVSCLTGGRGGGKSPVMYNCRCFHVCARVSTCHRRPADLLHNIVIPGPLGLPDTSERGIKCLMHKITVPMFAAVEDYTSIAKTKVMCMFSDMFKMHFCGSCSTQNRF